MNLEASLHEYNSIIIYRQNNPLPKETYTETHHIIPRSCGGTDYYWNLVKLLPEEHYRCHRLLPEIYKSGKEHYAMVCAWNFMSMNGKYFVTEEEYAEVRRTISIEYKKRFIDNPELRRQCSERAKKWMKEKPDSFKKMIEHQKIARQIPENRERFLKAIKKRDENEAYKLIRSAAQKRRYTRKEERDFQRQRHLGMKASVEARQKMSEFQNKRYLDPKERQKHANKGERNGMYGRRGENSIPHQMMWIKNEQLGESRYINKSEPIPNGWIRGRLNMYDRKKFAKKWITNGIEDKYISKDDNIPDGWRYGKTNIVISPNGKIWITDGVHNKLVDKTSSIPDGWKKGISSKKLTGGATTTGMFWINNGIKNKFCSGDIPHGWKKGRLLKKNCK